MKLFKPNTITAGLLVIFMFMNMAFLFHTHTCRSENECHVNDAQCCSSGGNGSEIPCCSAALDEESFSHRHQHSHCYGCCIVDHDDTAPLTDQLTPNKIKFERTVIIISGSLLSAGDEVKKIEYTNKRISQKTPAILFGKELVIFLHKVKIPSILSA